MKRRNWICTIVGLALLVPTVAIAAGWLGLPIIKVEYDISPRPEIAGYALVNPNHEKVTVFVYSTVAGTATPTTTLELLAKMEGNYVIQVDDVKDVGDFTFKTTSEADSDALDANERPEYDAAHFIEMVKTGQAVKASFAFDPGWAFSDLLELARVTVVDGDGKVVIDDFVDRR